MAFFFLQEDRKSGQMLPPDPRLCGVIRVVEKQLNVQIDSGFAVRLIREVQELRESKGHTTKVSVTTVLYRFKAESPPDGRRMSRYNEVVKSYFAEEQETEVREVQYIVDSLRKDNIEASFLFVLRLWRLFVAEKQRDGLDSNVAAKIAASNFLAQCGPSSEERARHREILFNYIIFAWIYLGKES